VSKVVVDSKQGSNLLYLPLDKIMQQVSTGVPVNGAAAATPAPAAPAAPAAPVELPPAMSSDTRSRDNARSRDVR